MSIPTILTIVALILAIVEEVQSQGRNYLAWGIIVCLAVALLWSRIG